jgi:signal transduction histidine kinase
VVQNLVENAIKYSPGGERVVVRVAARAGAVELRVEDEGIGLGADQLARVFEPFYRVDSSWTRRVGGTGLGLAIVRQLVSAHGGAVRAESAGPGRGSAFVVTLPPWPEGGGAAGAAEEGR